MRYAKVSMTRRRRAGSLVFASAVIVPSMSRMIGDVMTGRVSSESSLASVWPEFMPLVHHRPNAILFCFRQGSQIPTEYEHGKEAKKNVGDIGIQPAMMHPSYLIFMKELPDVAIRLE